MHTVTAKSILSAQNGFNIYRGCTHDIILFGAGLTLQDGDRQYYYKKLDEHFPGLKEKYITTFPDAAMENQLELF